jgi:hypothetical protein
LAAQPDAEQITRGYAQDHTRPALARRLACGKTGQALSAHVAVQEGRAQRARQVLGQEALAARRQAAQENQPDL